MTSTSLRATRFHLPSLSEGVHALGRIWASYRDWRETRAAISELHSLDDRMLRDMGLRRSEIESVVSGADHDTSRRPRT
jgi:uncharacterized protein YjiS (DUF1127 family)